MITNTTCLSTRAESTPEFSPVKMRPAELLPGKKGLDFQLRRCILNNLFNSREMPIHLVGDIWATLVNLQSQAWRIKKSTQKRCLTFSSSKLKKLKKSTLKKVSYLFHPQAQKTKNKTCPEKNSYKFSKKTSVLFPTPSLKKFVILSWKNYLKFCDDSWSSRKTKKFLLTWMTADFVYLVKFSDLSAKEKTFLYLLSQFT